MKFSIVIFCCMLFLFTGCAKKEPPLAHIDNTESAIYADQKDQKRDEIVQNALKHFNKNDGKDCSGFVSLVNKESDEPYFGASELLNYFEDARRSLAIYNLFKEQNRLYYDSPKLGDLVFFANTVKKYAQKRSIENITHIGIIIEINDDGTIHFIHHLKGKNLISQMNLSHPSMVNKNNKNINSYMEKCPKFEGHNCLAPAYFSAYGSIR